MSRSASIARFLAAWLILAATALFLSARTSFESVPAHQPLVNFPRDLQGWTGQDMSIDADVLRVLGPGDFLSRIYRNGASPEYIDFFVAYYPTQRTGDTLHSPQHCLPGAGWTPLSRDHIQIQTGSLTGGKAADVNRFIFAKGMDRVLVLYWYQAHGKATPSEYWAKYYLVKDSIALHRSDGAMVRVLTPIANSSDEDAAEARAVKFAQAALNNLGGYIPR
jgi:EpsI family protein